MLGIHQPPQPPQYALRSATLHLDKPAPKAGFVISEHSKVLLNSLFYGCGARARERVSSPLLTIAKRARIIAPSFNRSETDAENQPG